MIYALMLQNSGSVENERELRTALDWPVDEELWGETPEAEAGQNAMMRMFG